MGARLIGRRLRVAGRLAAAALLLAGLAAPHAARAVVVSMTASPPACGGAVTAGTVACPVDAGSSLSLVFALDAATALNGYQLNLRWDPSELSLLGASQLFPDAGTPVAFTSAPGDPAASVASAFVFPDPAVTTLLFQLDFQATPAGDDGQPDVWWFPQGAGLSPGSVVLENPAGAALDVTPAPVVPALPGALVPLLLAGLLAGGARRLPAARRIWHI